MNNQISYNRNPQHGGSQLRSFGRKLNLAAAEKQYNEENDIESINVPFSHSELREHAEKNKGRWKLLNEYPNRESRRQDISQRNQRRYNRAHPPVADENKIIAAKNEVQKLIHSALGTTNP